MQHETKKKKKQHKKAKRRKTSDKDEKNDTSSDEDCKNGTICELKKNVAIIMLLVKGKFSCL